MQAIDSLCPENVQAFLHHYKTSKINVKYEDRNCLHLLVAIFENSSKKNEFQNVADCIKLLLDAGCDPNMPDGDSKTPFFMLLKSKARLDVDLYKNLVQYFLEKSSVDVFTYRSEEMIQMLKIQGLPIPPKIERNINADFMRNLIDNKSEKDFIANFDEFKDRFEYVIDENGTISDKEDTAMLLNHRSQSKNNVGSASGSFKEICAIFLIEATKNALRKVVEFLLAQGVDINVHPKFDKPAAFLACSRGYHEILELLLNHMNSENVYDLEVNFKDKNLLHEVCCHFGYTSEVASDDVDQNYQKCFDLLMSCPEIDINQQDELGLTPIYYAIRYKNDEATKALLRKCYVGNRNIFNKAQIYHIRKEIFEEFLDECITRNIHEPTGEHRITIDFNFLVAPEQDGQDFFEEIAPLEDIANNAELRPLILHPVLSSFLYLKWIKLSILFYTNLIFFFFFMGSFITYIVLYKSDMFFYMSLMALILMMMKEVMQCFLSYKNYFKSHMNWFELMLIVLIWIVLLDNQYKSIHDDLVELIGIKTIRIIRGVTILCCTYEFLILFGDLPNFSVSTHMVILKRVFITFLKSIALYSILLVGFAFCFYTLFGESGKESSESETNETRDDDEDFHHFKYPGFAIIKTIVMFSGELEASNLNLRNNDAFYSVIFLLFVFLITIVLLNLLNGLSVSDVFQIKAEGHLVDLCQKIHVLNKYERIIMSRTGGFRFLKSIISIFPEFVQEGKIEIDANNKMKLNSYSLVPYDSILEQIYNQLLTNIIKFDSILKNANKLEALDNRKSKPEEFSIKIDSNIMKKVQLVLEERGEKRSLKDQQGRIMSIEAKLKLLAKMDQKLEYILDVLTERS